jgi:hypothetical protein
VELCYSIEKSLCFTVLKYSRPHFIHSTTLFHAYAYAIKECATENINKWYENGNIYYILLDSEAVNKALDNY